MAGSCKSDSDGQAWGREYSRVEKLTSLELRAELYASILRISFKLCDEMLCSVLELTAMQSTLAESYLWVDVLESKGSFILENDLGRNLLSNDLVKYGWLSSVSRLLCSDT